MTLENVKSRIVTILGLTLLVSLVITALGVASGDGRTQVFFSMVGVPMLLGALVGLARVRMAGSETALGTAGIQHHWITMSFAIAFLSLLPASFFTASAAVKGVAGVAAVILLLVPAWGLFDTRRATGVSLSV
jgi:hypothetical protein